MDRMIASGVPLLAEVLFGRERLEEGIIPDLTGGYRESGDGMPGDDEAGTRTFLSGDTCCLC